MSARSLNKVLLIGNLTRDPELRYTPQGTAVCTFGLATNRTWTPSDGGEQQEDVEYHRVVAWAKLAEICAQILYKGRKAYVEGRLQTRNWTGQDGQERQTTEVVIDSMIALGQPKPGAHEDVDEVDFQAGSKGDMPTGAGADSGKAAETKKTTAAKSTKKKNSDETVEDAETSTNSDKNEEVSADDIPF
jgi:single-strand DNA-binding protein